MNDEATWRRFEEVRDEAFRGLEMLREILSGSQPEYCDSLGRFWEGPTNPSRLPRDGERGRFDPNLCIPGCPTWREMEIPAMDIPYSFHCSREQDSSTGYRCYSIGTSFLWSGLRWKLEVAMVSRWLLYDGETWSDSGWRAFSLDSEDENSCCHAWETLPDGTLQCYECKATVNDDEILGSGSPIPTEFKRGA